MPSSSGDSFGWDRALVSIEGVDDGPSPDVERCGEAAGWCSRCCVVRRLPRRRGATSVQRRLSRSGAISSCRAACRRSGPACDRVRAVVHADALKYPALGHRKIWAVTIADGHQISMRTAHRILDELGLLHPRRYQAERRELARARRQTFRDPPNRRNRLWQADFRARNACRRHLTDRRRGQAREEVLPQLPGPTR